MYTNTFRSEKKKLKFKWIWDWKNERLLFPLKYIISKWKCIKIIRDKCIFTLHLREGERKKKENILDENRKVEKMERGWATLINRWKMRGRWKTRVWQLGGLHSTPSSVRWGLAEYRVHWSDGLPSVRSTLPVSIRALFSSLFFSSFYLYPPSSQPIFHRDPIRYIHLSDPPQRKRVMENKKK